MLCLDSVGVYPFSFPVYCYNNGNIRRMSLGKGCGMFVIKNFTKYVSQDIIECLTKCVYVVFHVIIIYASSLLNLIKPYISTSGTSLR